MSELRRLQKLGRSRMKLPSLPTELPGGRIVSPKLKEEPPIIKRGWRFLGARDTRKGQWSWWQNIKTGVVKRRFTRLGKG